MCYGAAACEAPDHSSRGYVAGEGYGSEQSELAVQITPKTQAGRSACVPCNREWLRLHAGSRARLGCGAAHSRIERVRDPHNQLWSQPPQNYNLTMLRPVEKRVPYGTIRNRMADGSEGARMRRVKGARHAHAAIREHGRTPGGEATPQMGTDCINWA